MASNVSSKDHSRDELFYLQGLVGTVPLQKVYLAVLLQDRPQRREVHLLEHRLIPRLLRQETFRLYLECVVCGRVVQVMREGSDEDIEPLLLRKTLFELLGAIVALVEKLGQGSSTWRTEKAWVKL